MHSIISTETIHYNTQPCQVIILEFIYEKRNYTLHYRVEVDRTWISQIPIGKSGGTYLPITD